jgi:hypothetical protein
MSDAGTWAQGRRPYRFLPQGLAVVRADRETQIGRRSFEPTHRRA